MRWLTSRKKRPNCPIVGDSWESYFYTYGEGQLARIGFDVAAGAEQKHKAYRNCRRVILFVDASRVREDGMPSDDDISQLISLEQALIAGLQEQAVDCRFVGRMTYGGMQEFVFQVEDAQQFDKTVSAWTGSVSAYKTEVRRETGWMFFDRKVRPSAAHQQQISDRRTIDALVHAGADTSRVHVLEHRFRGPIGELRHVAEELRTGGFLQVDLSDGTLVMSRPSSLDLRAVSELTCTLASFAEEVGVVYDGWGSEPARA